MEESRQPFRVKQRAAAQVLIERTEDSGAVVDCDLTLDFESITLHDDLVGRPRWTSAVRRLGWLQ